MKIDYKYKHGYMSIEALLLKKGGGRGAGVAVPFPL
jgi:hypothetical protein